MSWTMQTTFYNRDAALSTSVSGRYTTPFLLKPNLLSPGRGFERLADLSGRVSRRTEELPQPHALSRRCVYLRVTPKATTQQELPPAADAIHASIQSETVCGNQSCPCLRDVADLSPPNWLATRLDHGTHRTRRRTVLVPFSCRCEPCLRANTSTRPSDNVTLQRLAPMKLDPNESTVSHEGTTATSHPTLTPSISRGSSPHHAF